jgi:superfamily II DNA helicase RecQ
MKIAKDLILKDFLNQSGIVYCITKANCQAIAEFLVSFGLAATYYHSGLDEASRNDIQEKWMLGEVQVRKKETFNN